MYGYETLKKADLQAWLTRRHISGKDHWLRAQVIDCVDEILGETPLVQKIFG